MSTCLSSLLASFRAASPIRVESDWNEARLDGSSRYDIADGEVAEGEVAGRLMVESTGSVVGMTGGLSDISVESVEGEVMARLGAQ